MHVCVLEGSVPTDSVGNNQIVIGVHLLHWELQTPSLDIGPPINYTAYLYVWRITRHVFVRHRSYEEYGFLSAITS